MFFLGIALHLLKLTVLPLCTFTGQFYTLPAVSSGQTIILVHGEVIHFTSLCPWTLPAFAPFHFLCHLFV